MNTKLIINLREGILNVEGNDDFVRAIYDDFKGEVARRISKPIEPKLETIKSIGGGVVGEEEGSQETGRSTPRKRSTPEGHKARTEEYRPKFDSELNLNGLIEFYDELQPKNAAEKILLFATFLKENLQIEPCTADQIYTCFFTVKGRGKIPEAFVQAFRDTQSRTHYIQMNSLMDIRVTIAGSNQMETMKKRKAAS